MSIHRYLRPVNSLPQPDGPLSSSLPPVAIKEANKSVEAVYSTQKKRKRGTYKKMASEQQLAIAKYAALHCNQAAVCHFSKELEIVSSPTHCTAVSWLSLDTLCLKLCLLFYSLMLAGHAYYSFQVHPLFSIIPTTSFHCRYQRLALWTYT